MFDKLKGEGRFSNCAFTLKMYVSLVGISWISKYSSQSLSLYITQCSKNSGSYKNEHSNLRLFGERRKKKRHAISSDFPRAWKESRIRPRSVGGNLLWLANTFRLSPSSREAMLLEFHSSAETLISLRNPDYNFRLAERRNQISEKRGGFYGLSSRALRCGYLYLSQSD